MNTYINQYATMAEFRIVKHKKQIKLLHNITKWTEVKGIDKTKYEMGVQRNSTLKPGTLNTLIQCLINRSASSLQLLFSVDLQIVLAASHMD